MNKAIEHAMKSEIFLRDYNYTVLSLGIIFNFHYGIIPRNIKQIVFFYYRSKETTV